MQFHSEEHLADRCACCTPSEVDDGHDEADISMMSYSNGNHHWKGCDAHAQG